MPRDPGEVLREDRIRLLHMAESARRVQQFCSGITLEALQDDEMRLLAIVKSIEIIGEASTKISDETKQRVAGIDWVGVRRMRNRMIHGYDTIDVVRVWDAVQIDIPTLLAALEAELKTQS